MMDEEVARILNALEQGDPSATDRLLPVVYDRLRAMAAKALAAEAPGHTLTPTALVHEAYLRLAGANRPAEWDGRRHFLGAAAQAMRRILVESARKKANRRRLAGSPVELDSAVAALSERPEDLVALDEALAELAIHDPDAARLVELRFFAGLGREEAAAVMGLAPRTADRSWSLAKAWLYRRVAADRPA
ncbi:MAG TPA: ECF-type sigma factor [Planctomycetia bacterium]|nr:ECF-type sigma factor [Planctomycetia bacterium]